MQAQAKDLGFLAGDDAKVLATHNTPATGATGVGGQGYRGTIDQPDQVAAVQLLVA